MNQVSRQKAQTDVEKDFYKLMNNTDIGDDCRNNVDNSYFLPIYNEIDELLYTGRYQNVCDESISDFVSSEIVEKKIEEEFPNRFGKLDQNNNYYETRKNIPSRY